MYNYNFGKTKKTNEDDILKLQIMNKQSQEKQLQEEQEEKEKEEKQSFLFNHLMSITSSINDIKTMINNLIVKTNISSCN